MFSGKKILVYVVCILVIFSHLAMAAHRMPVCDTPCRTGGHVATCCRSHGSSDGECRGADAWC
ncbi:unnamed protein product, partial [Rotaria magnacalcarata]